MQPRWHFMLASICSCAHSGCNGQHTLPTTAAASALGSHGAARICGRTVRGGGGAAAAAPPLGRRLERPHKALADEVAAVEHLAGTAYASCTLHLHCMTAAMPCGYRLRASACMLRLLKLQQAYPASAGKGQLPQR